MMRPSGAGLRGRRQGSETSVVQDSARSHAPPEGDSAVIYDWITCVRKPGTTVPTSDAVACPASHSTKFDGTAGCMLSHELLLERPTRFDRVEIGRVRGKVEGANPVCLAGRLDAGVVVGAKVVHHQDIAATKFRQEFSAKP